MRPRWKFLPRNPLVVVQIAFSLALLTAAALFVRGAAKRRRSIPDCMPRILSSSKSTPASAASIETRARDLYRTLREKFAALPGVRAREHFARPCLSGCSVASAKRATRRPAADHGPTRNRRRRLMVSLSARLEQRRRGLFFSRRFAAAARPRLYGGGSDEPGGPAGRDHRRSAREETLAERRCARAANPVPDPEGRAAGEARCAERRDPSRRTRSKSSASCRQRRRVSSNRSQPGALYLPFARGFQSDVFFFIKFASLSSKDETATADLLRRTVQEVDPVLPVLELRTFARHMEANPSSGS